MNLSMTRAEKIGGIIVAAATVAVVATFLVVRVQRPAKYKHEFAVTLNQYLGSHQACLWPDSIQFPARIDPSDNARITRFDALVDAGLLERVPAGRERHARHADSTVEYRLSDMGRLNWTPDAARTGYGNFCYGHMAVSSVNTFKRVSGRDSTAFLVIYRDSVMLPAWAQVPEVEKAFPKLARAGRGETDFATLVQSGNNWRVRTITSPGGRVV